MLYRLSSCVMPRVLRIRKDPDGYELSTWALVYSNNIPGVFYSSSDSYENLAKLA